MNIAAKLRQTITGQSPGATAANASADPSYGAKWTAAARVEPYARLVRQADGQDVPATHRVYSSRTITQFDRIWLPGDDTSSSSTARRVLSLKTEVDQFGRTSFYAAVLT